jgi:hypothetical protein
VKKVFKKLIIPKRCGKFEGRLDDYLDGAADTELQLHLDRCADCRTALEDMRLAGNLLRQTWDPTSEPRPAFLTGVMARIREQKAREASPVAFWAPLEFLASRISLSAAVLLLALSAYVMEYQSRRDTATLSHRTELSASDLPQPPGDPVSNEEVLLSLAERNNGR